MNLQHLKNVFSYWMIPEGIKNVCKKSIKLSGKSEKHLLHLCSSNIVYKNIHKGKRCFIVCSGPSINKQNLLPLKNEITFFVSSGFLHPYYSVIQPKYHCTPSVRFTPKLNSEKYVEWFKLMDSIIGNTQLFLSAVDWNFIKQNNLFSIRHVSYLNMVCDWDSNQKTIYDIAQRIPGIQSVPIMAIMIAMYMGCKEIYLLGVELDDLWSGVYRHFYENEIMRDDVTVSEDYRSTIPLIEMFKINYNLWLQFDILKRIAEANNIEILNATRGGALDVYKRVVFEDLFSEALC